MNDNKLFSIEQYGFRTGHAAGLAALHLVNDLAKQMDTGKVPTNIPIGLSKAFDTLDHSIFKNKNKNKNEFITITETMMEIIHY